VDLEGGGRTLTAQRRAVNRVDGAAAGMV